MPPIVTSAEIESPPAEVFAYAFDQVHDTALPGRRR